MLVLMAVVATHRSHVKSSVPYLVLKVAFDAGRGGIAETETRCETKMRDQHRCAKHDTGGFMGKRRFAANIQVFIRFAANKCSSVCITCEAFHFATRITKNRAWKTYVWRYCFCAYSASRI